jgi:hypothetical protein
MEVFRFEFSAVLDFFDGHDDGTDIGRATNLLPVHAFAWIVSCSFSAQASLAHLPGGHQCLRCSKNNNVKLDY